MPIDPESWEPPLETRHRENPGHRRPGHFHADASDRDRDRPPRARSRDRPRRPARIGPDDPDESWRRRPNPLPIAPHPRAFRRLVSTCEGRTDLLDVRHARRFRPALLALSAHHRGWLRPPEEWDPPEGDADADADAGADAPFAGLVRHLFARYDVPRFLDSAWMEGLTPEGLVHQGWYRHIAGGGSIRTADDLPAPMTRRMAHHFLGAPDDCDIPAAIRYAQVLGLGGSDRLARGLLGTRLGRPLEDGPFWETVVRWFVAHPALDPLHHGPIVDYLHHQKFVPSVVNPSSRVRGQPRRSLLVAAQPDLAMKGRTPDALLRAVDRWHRELGAARPAVVMEWKPSGIAPLAHAVGDGPDRRLYATTELICAGELQEEGTAMRHCVASYWSLCASGQSSIWSLTAEDAAGRVERLLTLEVRSPERMIVQARGLANRPPTPEELGLLAHWGDAGGPGLRRWTNPEPVIDVAPGEG